MKIRKGYLIDVDYIVKGKTTYMRLVVKGKRYCRVYFQYDPYFYSDIPLTEAEELVKKNMAKKVERVRKDFGKEEREVTKIYVFTPPEVMKLRDYIYHQLGYECYEYDVPVVKSFLADFHLVPLALIKYKREGGEIKEFIDCDEGKLASFERRMGFDIEVYNPEGAPNPKKDAVIMVSYKTPEENKVITYKLAEGVKNVIPAKSERDMLEKFYDIVKEYDPEILYGYNSSNFDIPYLRDRGKKIKVEVKLGRWKNKIKKKRKGLVVGVKVDGRIHFDVYPASRLFGQIGVIPTMNKFTLYDIYESVTGKEKLMVNRMDIWRMWDSADISQLLAYSAMDAEAVFEIGEALLGLEKELSALARMPLFDTTLSTTGQLVESILIHEARKRNLIVPRKPKEQEIRERMLNPIKGGFVKLPEPGIYENIVVFDFRGLYPSIIISYNIDPLTLDENGEFVSPTGARFRKSPKGLIPSVLAKLVDTRAEIKKKLKELDKSSPEYRVLYERSQALKILANSFYGYLGYARSRWYNRECAESVTAWGRKHIQEAAKEAEKFGFKVLYIDTDSLFLLLGDKSKEEALKFMEYINNRLPEKMELELEDFYVRGVFVSKKSEAKGAKKKYALINEKGEIKIRGFELVRRDWSGIAKKTQKEVLYAILKGGSKERAVEIVRETIEKLRKGEVDKEDLIIYTELKKDPHSYEVLSPEVSAALKLEKILKRRLHVGSVVGYIITKKGKSISEKAMPAELVKEGDYDPEYYINNQVIPAVMKILKELGVEEEELRGGGKQRSLSEFFS